MNINGTLKDEDLVEFIGTKLKLETIKGILDSTEYTDSQIVDFLRMYIKEA